VLDDQVHLEQLTGLDTGKVDPFEVITKERTDSFSGLPYRPVSMASFVLSWITRGDAVRDLKYTNLMIHLLSGVLVFWLAGRLLMLVNEPIRGRRWWWALWVAAAWMLAPLYVSTVLYIIQRMAQLSTLFTLCGLLTYVVARQNIDKSFWTGVLLLVLVFGLFWPLAIFSKENGILLPALTFVIESFFFRFTATRRTRRLLQAFYTLLFVFGVVGAAFILLNHPDWVTKRYVARSFTLEQRLLTEARILWVYLLQLVTPRGSMMGVHHDDFPPSESVLEPVTTLISALLWAVILATAWRYRASRPGLILSGLVFFLAGHLVESTILPLELYFEHRNYLPGFGVFLGLAVALGTLTESRVLASRRIRKLVLALIVMLPAVYGIGTYQRVLAWQSWSHILLTAAEAHPESARLNIDLATYNLKKGRLERALEHLERAKEIDPRKAAGVAVHRILGYCTVGGDVPEWAYEEVAAAPDLSSDSYSVNALALLVREVKKGRCAKVDLNRVALAMVEIIERSNFAARERIEWSALVHTAQLLMRTGHLDKALEYTNRALEVKGESFGTGLLKFQLHMLRGEIDAAERQLAWLQERKRNAVKRYRMRLEYFQRMFEKYQSG